MKKILILLLLFVGLSYGQKVTQDFYGANNGTYSDSLQIAVGDSATGEYYIFDHAFYIQVDTNWTTSNIAIAIYNPVTQAYELLQDEDKTLIEIGITEGKTTRLKQSDFGGADRVKFIKMTSGSDVDQATHASTLIIHSLRY